MQDVVAGRLEQTHVDEVVAHGLERGEAAAGGDEGEGATRERHLAVHVAAGEPFAAVADVSAAVGGTDVSDGECQIHKLHVNGNN